MKKMLSLLMIVFLCTVGIPKTALGATISATPNSKITVLAPDITVPEDENGLTDGKMITIKLQSEQALISDSEDGKAVCAVFIAWYSETGRYLNCTIVNNSYWRWNRSQKAYTASVTPGAKIWPAEYPVQAKIFVWTTDGSVIPVSDVYTCVLLNTQGILERDLPGFTASLQVARFDSDDAESISAIVLSVCEDLQGKIDSGVQVNRSYLETTYKTEIASAKQIYSNMNETDKSSFTSQMSKIAGVYPELRDCLLNMFDLL